MQQLKKRRGCTFHTVISLQISRRKDHRLSSEVKEKKGKKKKKQGGHGNAVTGSSKDLYLQLKEGNTMTCSPKTTFWKM